MTLNEQIAKVKGWHWAGREDGEDVGYDTREGAARVMDWKGVLYDAWFLVDELVAEGAYVCLESPTAGVKEGGDATWRCSVEMPDERMIAKDAGTAAEAICHAYLEAMG